MGEVIRSVGVIRRAGVRIAAYRSLQRIKSLCSTVLKTTMSQGKNIKPALVRSSKLRWQEGRGGGIVTETINVEEADGFVELELAIILSNDVTDVDGLSSAVPTLVAAVEALDSVLGCH